MEFVQFVVQVTQLDPQHGRPVVRAFDGTGDRVDLVGFTVQAFEVVAALSGSLHVPAQLRRFVSQPDGRFMQVHRRGRPGRRRRGRRRRDAARSRSPGPVVGPTLARVVSSSSFHPFGRDPAVHSKPESLDPLQHCGD